MAKGKPHKPTVGHAITRPPHAHCAAGGSRKSGHAVPCPPRYANGRFAPTGGARKK